MGGESLGGVGRFSKADFTSFIMFPLRVRGLLQKAFPCVCGCKRYLFMATPRVSASMYTNIDEVPVMISGKGGKCRNLHHFGGILMVFRRFYKANFTSFIMYPIRGRASPEGISVRLRLKAVLIPGES